MAFIISILIPNAIGFIGGLIGNSSNGFKDMIKPNFTPPSIVFPIVWVILFTLMGISTYIIYKSHSNEKKNAFIIYGVQLIANALWNLFFFRLKWYLFAFFWVLLLIVLVIYMINSFYKVNKISAYLQIPYLLWLIFAAILSYNVYLLN